MFPMPNTCMALQGRLAAAEFIAGIFLILTLFQIHVLTCSAPCREQGFGPTMEKNNLNSNNRLFFGETCFGRVSRKITRKGEKKNPQLDHETLNIW